jgi:hypothetical protein
MTHPHPLSRGQRQWKKLLTYPRKVFTGQPWRYLVVSRVEGNSVTQPLPHRSNNRHWAFTKYWLRIRRDWHEADYIWTRRRKRYEIVFSPIIRLCTIRRSTWSSPTWMQHRLSGSGNRGSPRYARTAFRWTSQVAYDQHRPGAGYTDNFGTGPSNDWIAVGK